MDFDPLQRPIRLSTLLYSIKANSQHKAHAQYLLSPQNAVTVCVAVEEGFTWKTAGA